MSRLDQAAVPEGVYDVNRDEVEYEASAEAGSEAMALNPPEVREVALRDPPLDQVIVQLKFSPILSVSQAEFIAPFQEAIRSEYPNLEEEERIQIGVAAAPPIRTTLWRFLSLERSWVVGLASDFLSLETKSYTSFDDFSKRFGALLEALVKHLNPSQQIRLGLRYVNDFYKDERRRSQDWRDYIRPELLGALANDVIGDVERAVHEIRVRQDDGKFTLKLGWIRREGQDVPHLILDFDYYDDTQQQLANEAVMASLTRFHDVVYRMFRWSVTDSLLRELGPEDDGYGL